MITAVHTLVYAADPDAARAFYEALFGFRYEGIPDEAGDYRIMFRPGEDHPLGGVGPLLGDEGTPHWIVYFGVADSDAAASAAEDGGSVLSPPFDTPYGRMAGLVDPGGAAFWVVQDTSGNQPDRSG